MFRARRHLPQHLNRLSAKIAGRRCPVSLSPNDHRAEWLIRLLSFQMHTRHGREHTEDAHCWRLQSSLCGGAFRRSPKSLAEFVGVRGLRADDRLFEIEFGQIH